MHGNNFMSKATALKDISHASVRSLVLVRAMRACAGGKKNLSTTLGAQITAPAIPALLITNATNSLRV